MDIIKIYPLEVNNCMFADYLELNVDETQVVFYGHETNSELYRTRLDEFEQFFVIEEQKLENGKTIGAILTKL